MMISAPFVRDPFTWLAYLMLGYYAYLQSTLGPLMPFLGAELNLNYTVRGYHLSGFAVGMILAGLTSDQAARRFGRRAVFWGGGLGMGLGALMLVFGRAVPVTVAGSFVMGFLGSNLLVMQRSTLSTLHGERRAIALTESNVVAVLFAAVAPVLIGQGEQAGIGWRVALLVGAALWLAMFVIGRKIPIPTSSGEESHHEPPAPLPRLFWAYALVVFFAVSIEWSIIFWGADYLEKVVGLERTLASPLMSVFLGAMFVGRALGSGLARRFPPGRLLLGAILVVMVGFPLFWLAQVPALNIIGLFVAGLGVANMFPFTLSVASGLVPTQVDTLSARISFSSGLAILVMPQLLGSAADQIGIWNAFAIVGGLVVAVFVVAWLANRAAHMTDSHQMAGPHAAISLQPEQK
jgi:MFS family permease